MSSALVNESGLDSWLRTRGNQLLGRPHPPLTVRLEKNTSTHTAWLGFDDAEIRVAIKELHRDVSEGTSRDLIRICRSVVAINGALTDHLPRFLGCSPTGRHVAMEFIPGWNLERLLMSALRRRAGCDPYPTRVLAASARVLAALHDIRSDRVGLPRSSRSIASFLDGMRRTASSLQEWGLLDRAVERLVGAASAAAGPILECAGSSLLPTDAQPKNILVPSESRVCFIDLDFTSGPRGLGVAFFLVSLDRIALRSHGSRALEIVDAWKRAFAQSYLEASDPHVAREIDFFYPWMLVQVMSDHLRQRPLLSWPLAARYRWLLRAVSLRSSSAG